MRAAVVVNCDGQPFSAHRDLDGMVDGDAKAIPIQPSSRRTLAGAVVAFDGRTPAKLEAARNQLGRSFMELGWTITMPGAPMIVKVPFGQVDAVFRTSRSYDFAPAAFIAEKAGVCVGNWAGQSLGYCSIALDPSVKHHWLVAANTDLERKLRMALSR